MAARIRIGACSCAGLIAFYQDNLPAADQAWKSLDPQRRPHRIAAVLLAAEAGEVKPQQPLPVQDNSNTDLGTPIGSAASTTTIAERANLVRRFRHERPALQTARKITSIRHRDPHLKFSAYQLNELANLRVAWSRLDSEFVRPFELACMQLCFLQPLPAIFELAKQRIPGPNHDRMWNLQAYSYYLKFQGASQQAESSLRKFLHNDLPHFNDLSAELRGAITSLLEYRSAQCMLSRQSSPFFGASMTYREIDLIYERSIKAYPEHRAAHEARVANLEEAIDEMRSKLERNQVERQLLAAYQNWHRALPNDVPPRLWLIDYHFDDDDLDKAQPLIDSLSDVRLDDPILKSLPWKLKLRQALADSRRKNSIDKARKNLAEADSMWPSWLPKTWLGFLYAALELRTGNRTAFEQKLRAAAASVHDDPLLRDVMIFGANQHMNVPSAVIKPFRASVQQHVNTAQTLSLPQLTQLGSVFWDLQRISLFYPGYRMHGSKFGNAFVGRLASLPGNRRVEGIEAACLWAADSHFWGNPYEPTIPLWLVDNCKSNRLAALAIVRSLTSVQYVCRMLRVSASLVEDLKRYAKNESDPYYRFALADTAAHAEQKIADWKAEYGSGRGHYFESDSEFSDDDDETYDMRNDDDDYDDDYDEDPDDFDDDENFDTVGPEFNVPQLPAPIKRMFAKLFAQEFLTSGPPKLRSFFARIGTDGLAQLITSESDRDLTRFCKRFAPTSDEIQELEKFVSNGFPNPGNQSSST